MTDVDRDFLARQNERILTELHSMRDEMGGMRDDSEPERQSCGLSGTRRETVSWDALWAAIAAVLGARFLKSMH